MTEKQLSQSTEKSYSKVVASALNHSRSKRNYDPEAPSDISLTDVARDLIDRQDVSQATKITSRSALLWFFKVKQDQESSDTMTAIETLQEMDMRMGRPITRRPQGITQKDLDLLLQELSKRSTKSVWAGRCAVWIQAGLICGARPIEWLDIEWSSPEKNLLKIKNAKLHHSAPAFMKNKKIKNEDSDDIDAEYQSKDRTHRLIPIDSSSDRTMIDMHLNMIEDVLPKSFEQHDRDSLFYQYHQSCKLILNRACRKVWKDKKLYSLYTMRKQFSANMKASLGSVVTAGLMGHSGPDSPSAASYGKANQAHARFRKTKASVDTWRQVPSLKDAGTAARP